VVGHVISLWVLALYSLVCFIFSLKFNQIISKIFDFFGRRTYGIFLGHFFFLSSFNEIFPNTLLGNFLETLVIFLLSTFVGSVSWLLLEKPFLKLSSHLESKI